MILDADQIRAIQESVEQLILRSPAPLTEHFVIKEVERQGLFDGIPGTEAALALFRKHFLIMHVLYRLQMQFEERGDQLHVSALAIELVSKGGVESGSIASPEASLRDYYLDLEEFDEVSEADVVTLLNGFWRKYERWQTTDQACKILGVPPDATWPAVQAAWRRAAAATHPDKGGDPVQFRKVFEAYQSLKLKLKFRPRT